MANSTEVESICSRVGFAKFPKRKTPSFTAYPLQNQNPPVSRFRATVSGSSSCRYMAEQSRLEISNVRTLRNSSHLAASRKTAVSKYASSRAFLTESRISPGSQKTASFLFETWRSFHDSLQAKRNSAPSEPFTTLAENSQAGVGRWKTGRSDSRSRTASSKPYSPVRTSETPSESAGNTGSETCAATVGATVTELSASFSMGTSGVSAIGRRFALRHPKYAAIPTGRVRSAAKGANQFGVAVGTSFAGAVIAEPTFSETPDCQGLSKSAALD